MKNDLRAQAELLEELLPNVIRVLFPGSENEPLSELPVSQLRVLRLLWTAPKTSSELAETLHITPQAIAQVISKLEGSGMVKKTCIESDRRQKTLELSEQCRCLMQFRRTVRAERAAEILLSIAPEDRCALIEVLQRIGQSPTLRRVHESLTKEGGLEEDPETTLEPSE